ncbi:iron ABC transporter ATP-binding protein FetA [Serratia sp. M24T3]|uniref:iron efflux ABC transporter ATP-binding subunit FetA n=1 Tax=Serratia sp. M24T3 TaxID=932213 RepID=UPI00025BAAF4|nr:iron ABC transporter ATP-binding protein FetA [Serratia sp. M24T3]EIC82391.1 putative ABC transporter ATP-binding protein YbbL [Serratia sp. M24T3]
MSSPKTLLRLQNVSFSLNQQVLLRPTSFELNSGEFCLLTGPSGSGKSTLLKIVASLQNPTQGQIFFEGQDITQMKPEIYRQQVSYCFQTPVLFGQTVLDNLSLPYEIRGKKADKSLMAEWLTRVNLPVDLLNKNVQELSGGEKQRVSLLRNLQFLPKVLLLDEITSALDEDNKQNVNAIIADLVKQQGLAVIWVTHDTNEIRHAQRVITLKHDTAGENTRESA